MSTKNIVILGSTGSIGESTIDVVMRHPDRYRIYALSAHSRIGRLIEQAKQCAARVVVVPDDNSARRFKQGWDASLSMPDIRVGQQGLIDTAADSETDIVMAAIVGAAGLPSALAAARAGKRVLLANKEALVAAGSLFMATVRENGAELLPIDSEHNAIFQCLPHQGRALAPTEPAPGVRRLILTASGGPFRRHQLADLDGVTPEQACAHPNWSMGRKISVDSATMLNKGLEVIEAHWLFAMPPDRIESGVNMLDLASHGTLDFESPDLERFPCLSLSFQALRAGQHACLTLNAANEVAVAAFLDHRLPFTWIPRVIEASLEWQAGLPSFELSSLDAVLDLDARVRTFAGNLGLAI